MLCLITKRDKRVRDNSIKSWGSVWLPISQFHINNDNTVLFTNPMITVGTDGFIIFVTRMVLMKVTDQPPHPPNVQTEFSLPEHNIKDSIVNYVSPAPHGDFSFGDGCHN